MRPEGVSGVQAICEEVCPGRRLHYVYIPEGNKTHSLYWTSEFWIPALHQVTGAR